MATVMEEHVPSGTEESVFHPLRLVDGDGRGCEAWLSAGGGLLEL